MLTPCSQLWPPGPEISTRLWTMWHRPFVVVLVLGPSGWKWQHHNIWRCYCWTMLTVMTVINVTLYLCFNGHFPGGPDLPGSRVSPFWIGAKDDWDGGSNRIYMMCKAQVNSSPPAKQHPAFLQARCPSCRPANSVKSLKGKISHSMDLLTPSSPGVFHHCMWPLIAPDFLGGWSTCLSSVLLTPVSQVIIIITTTIFIVLSSWPRSLREFTRFIWWM